MLIRFNSFVLKIVNIRNGSSIIIGLPFWGNYKKAEKLSFSPDSSENPCEPGFGSQDCNG